MTPRPDLSVIVVTWNVRDLALTCVERLRERAGSLALQILVVDNASADGTAEAIRRRLPEVTLLEAGANLGFPRANNLALMHATGRHVLFLNPDTEVGEGTLERCVAELDAHPGLGAVGCRLEYPDGRVQPDGARRHYRLRHLLWESLYLHMLFPRSRFFAHQVMGDWDHRGVRDVEALSGAFLMARREAAVGVGGLPDEVFMYHEDMAFCLRVERQGWRIRYLGDVVTLHRSGSAASASGSPLGLLLGEVQVRLIRERSGLVAGVLARVLVGVRALARLILGMPCALVPALRRRFPRMADLRNHGGLLLWAVRPGWARRRMAAAGIPADERPGLLVVGPTPPPVHGVAAYTQMLVSSLELRQRFRVCHVDTADRRSLDNLGRVDPTNVFLGLRHLAHVTAAVLRERPAVVYVPVSQNAPAFTRDALFIGVAAAGGARVVTHLHGGYFKAFYAAASAPLRALIRWAHRRVYRAWVLGEGLRDMYGEILPPEKVRVVPNGVVDLLEGKDPPDGRPSPDGTSLPARGSGGPLRVLFLGSVGLGKGVEVLLDAAALLKARGVAVHLTVAGPWRSEEDRRRLEPRLRALAEHGAAAVPGVVVGPEKLATLLAADAFVLATIQYEGQPIAVLEAMAAGLPVVATPRAAIPDMVVDGETGIMVEESSAASLAAALERLAGDPELRLRMGAAGRARYLERFTRERALARAVEELEEAAQGVQTSLRSSQRLVSRSL